jgi:hypothetical protein
MIVYFIIPSDTDFDDDQFSDRLAIFAREQSTDEKYFLYPILSHCTISDILDLKTAVPNSNITVF